MPSRALYVPHPFGLTFGDVGDVATQRIVLEAMLEAAVSMTHRGVRDSGLVWPGDLRHRQLRKQAR